MLRIAHLAHGTGGRRAEFGRARTCGRGRASSRSAGSTPSSINASGCGTTVKDYGHLLARDPAWGETARRVAALARDVSEVLSDSACGAPVRSARLSGRLPRSVLDAACSARDIRSRETLLRAAGFHVLEVPEKHFCCGSAGTYNLLQPEMADGAWSAKGRSHRQHRSRHHRDRQYRLHDAARALLPNPDRSYGRAVGLGDRGPATAGARRASRCASPCDRPGSPLRADQRRQRADDVGIW